MPYHRGAVLTGEEIEFRIVFRDAAGNLVDPDDVPNVYIYGPNVESEVVAEEALVRVYTSALAGPFVSTRLSAGYYSYAFEVPSGADEGIYYDVWEADIDGAEVHEIFNFTVTQGADLDAQAIQNNTLLVVELSNEISNADSDQYLEPTSLYYSTVYSPLYASPTLVRMELGPWVDWIPEDTLALMLHWSSLEADFIQAWRPHINSHMELARTKFVIYDAVVKILSIPGQGQLPGWASGRSKKLGDLAISDGTPHYDVDKNMLGEFKRLRDEWWRVVNAGAQIVPGQGLDPAIAVKGLRDPDRRNVGRLWDQQGDFPYSESIVNGKRAPMKGRRRGRFGYVDPHWSFNET